MLFAVVALTAINCAVAIIRGENAARGQFPYFVYFESYTIHKIDLVLATTTVIFLNIVFPNEKII